MAVFIRVQFKNSSDPRRRGRTADDLQTGRVYLASFPPSQLSSSSSLAEGSQRYLKAAILHSNTMYQCSMQTLPYKITSNYS